MAVPFQKYLAIKDNYCLSYFGENQAIVRRLLEARDVLERNLVGLKIYLVFNDNMRVHGKRNIILSSQMRNYQGKFAESINIEKEEDINEILEMKAYIL